MQHRLSLCLFLTTLSLAKTAKPINTLFGCGLVWVQKTMYQTWASEALLLSSSFYKSLTSRSIAWFSRQVRLIWGGLCTMTSLTTHLSASRLMSSMASQGFIQTEAWCDSWESATVVNQSIVTDPTIWQPGFHLPRLTWCALNRFCTGQGLRAGNLHKWELVSSDKCGCGIVQTLSHTD